VTLVRHKIPLKKDSFNLAVVKQETTSQYVLRYFGFDFSQKDQPVAIPTIEKESTGSIKLSGYEIRMLDARIKNVISLIFDGVFALFKESLLLKKVPVLKTTVAGWCCKAVKERLKNY
jgi:hypothetical protein